MELRYYNEILSQLFNGKDFCEEVFSVVENNVFANIEFQMLQRLTTEIKNKNLKAIDELWYFTDILLPSTKNIIHEYLREKLNDKPYGLSNKCLLMIHLEHFIAFANFLKNKVIDK